MPHKTDYKELFRPNSVNSIRGGPAFDNLRENIDPHLRTRVISTQEGTIEKTPSASNDITNKAYVDSVIAVDLSQVAEDIIPNLNDTYDLGSFSKKWAFLFATVAILGSIVIGGAIGLSNVDGILFVNASTTINGTLTAFELKISGNSTFQNITVGLGTIVNNITHTIYSG